MGWSILIIVQINQLEKSDWLQYIGSFQTNQVDSYKFKNLKNKWILPTLLDLWIPADAGIHINHNLNITD